MAKLTKAQWEVLSSMRMGYELWIGLSSILLSYGNYSKYVHKSTFNGLSLRGFIKQDDHTHNLYILTETGREALDDHD